MTNYKVVLSSSLNYNIKSVSPTKYKITTTPTSGGGIQVPAKFEDLIDFDNTNKNDKYVIMYDAATETYKMVNPDQVLSAAATEPISPGLPSDFENQLDIDLDNRINLDAGTF